MKRAKEIAFCVGTILVAASMATIIGLTCYVVTSDPPLTQAEALRMFWPFYFATLAAACVGWKLAEPPK